jgi:hypothetical protein
MNFDINNTNVGSTDRVIRAIVGVVMIIGAVRGSSWTAGVIGAILLGTAYLRFCPAYAALGFNSNKDEAPTAK